MRTCNISVCLVARERKEGGRWGQWGRERRGMREGQAAVIGKVKRQGACQGVTHVPQGWVIRGGFCHLIHGCCQGQITGLVCVKTLFIFF